MNEWNEWMCLNVQKTKLITFCLNGLKLDSSCKFKLQGNWFIPSQSIKNLGVLLDEHLQLSHVKLKLSRAIGILSNLRYNPNSEILKITYRCLFYSYLLRACQLWGQKNLSSLNQSQILQNRALWMMTCKKHMTLQIWYIRNLVCSSLRAWYIYKTTFSCCK